MATAERPIDIIDLTGDDEQEIVAPEVAAAEDDEQDLIVLEAAPPAFLTAATVPPPPSSPLGDPAADQTARSRSSSVEFVSERAIAAASRPRRARRKRPQQAPGPERLSKQQRRADRIAQLQRSKVTHVQGGSNDHLHKLAAKATARSGNFPNDIEDSPALTMYTDGYIVKNRYGGGAAVYKTGSIWTGRAMALGEMTRSGDAEMSAISSALDFARKIRQPHQRRLIFVTDSGDVLKWTAEGCRNNNLMAVTVQRTRQEQQELGRDGIKVIFQWIKGHSGDESNDMADRVARFGSEKAAKGHMQHYDIADVEAETEAPPERPSKKKKPLTELGSRELDRLGKNDGNMISGRATAAVEGNESASGLQRPGMGDGDAGEQSCRTLWAGLYDSRAMEVGRER